MQYVRLIAKRNMAGADFGGVHVGQPFTVDEDTAAALVAAGHAIDPAAPAPNSAEPAPRKKHRAGK